MTAKNIQGGALSRHLRKLHAHTQNTEEQILGMIEQVKVTGSEANQAEIDFTSFASSFTNLILTVKNLTSTNQELNEALKVSIANKVANAVMVAENMDLLAQVDYIYLANQIIKILDQETIEHAVKELDSWGDEGRERLKWFAHALKKEGYCVEAK